MDGSVSYFPATDEFMLSINGNMIFVAKKGFAVLLGPASINIFSPTLVLTPLNRGLAFALYLCIFFTAIALYRRLHNGGVHDLPFQGRVATLLQVQQRWPRKIEQAVKWKLCYQ